MRLLLIWKPIQMCIRDRCNPDPSISCRIHKGTPEIVWQLALESSKISGGVPTLENDEDVYKRQALPTPSIEIPKGGATNGSETQKGRHDLPVMSSFLVRLTGVEPVRP